MARNTEVVWQWEILRSIDAATQGVTVTKLAAERGVRERTIRCDLDALGRAATRALFAHTVEAAKDACARKLTSITRRATPCSDAPTRHPVPGSTSQGVRRPRESRGRP